MNTTELANLDVTHFVSNNISQTGKLYLAMAGVDIDDQRAVIAHMCNLRNFDAPRAINARTSTGKRARALVTRCACRDEWTANGRANAGMSVNSSKVEERARIATEIDSNVEAGNIGDKHDKTLSMLSTPTSVFPTELAVRVNAEHRGWTATLTGCELSATEYEAGLKSRPSNTRWCLLNINRAARSLMFFNETGEMVWSGASCRPEYLDCDVMWADLCAPLTPSVFNGFTRTLAHRAKAAKLSKSGFLGYLGYYSAGGRSTMFYRNIGVIDEDTVDPLEAVGNYAAEEIRRRCAALRIKVGIVRNDVYVGTSPVSKIGLIGVGIGKACPKTDAPFTRVGGRFSKASIARTGICDDLVTV